MRKYFFLALISTNAFSQTDLYSQSSPSINWEERHSKHVRLIYPEKFRDESQYVTGLIDHYSTVVGKTYRITDPKQFTLVIRPEIAQPNGFVTLAPRRSEWYDSSMFFPAIGGTEWFQTLSIHEYRHVMQYDHYRYSTVKVLDYLFGDTGRMLALFAGLQPWYFEGDAVWAETKYTDGGRGRSPRFVARLKALILSDDIPTYDEFVNGSYRTQLPNHYIFGYVIISNATKKFGEEFWRKVTRRVAIFPHPWRLVEAFETVSGQNFQDFYNETMQDLRERWKDDMSDLTLAEYRDETYPFKVDDRLYFLQYNLDSYHHIVTRDGDENVKVADIPFQREFNQVHIARNRAVYSQYLPDRRYGFKGSSDVVVVDLKSGKKVQITKQRRLYNPKLNLSADKIIATEFLDDRNWRLTEIDLKTKKISGFKVDGFKPSEAIYLNDETIVAILNDKTGQKSIQQIDLKSKERKTLLPASRNVIFNLSADTNGAIYFESQYQGKVEIVRVTQAGITQKCTTSKIGAFSPSADSSHLYYSDMDTNGSKIKSVPLSECADISQDTLIDYNYLSKNSPSDNYNEFPVVAFPEQTGLKDIKDDHAHETYSDLDKRVVIPHSWNFFTGRGSGVSFRTDNYLRSIDTNVLIGSDSEGNGTYTLVDLNFKKYYPVINLHLDAQGREIERNKSEDDISWKENNAGLNVLVPYVKKKDLFNFRSELMGGISYKGLKNYEFNEIKDLVRDQNFHVQTLAFTTRYSKDQVARSIVSPYDFSYSIQADVANNVSNKDFSSFRIYQSALAQIPGLFNHQAFSLRIDRETQREDSGSYRFLPGAIDPYGYVFSRGYSYKSVNEYSKASLNYLLPVAYPDLAIGSLYYMRRLYANLFFDTTKIDDVGANPTYTSYGLEAFLESKIARVLPLTFGFRTYYKDSDQEAGFDMFAGTTYDY